MKKNKGLVIGVIIVIIILAVAAWYFFFRTDNAKLGDEIPTPDPPDPEPGPLDQFVCPPGTSGTYPVCTLNAVNPDIVFANAIIEAKLRVTNNTSLNDIQKIRVISIIDIYVTQNKDRILADTAGGKNIVNLILLDAEGLYLRDFGVASILSNRPGAGKG